MSWDDVAGLEMAKEALKEAVILPIKFPQLFQVNISLSSSCTALHLAFLCPSSFSFSVSLTRSLPSRDCVWTGLPAAVGRSLTHRLTRITIGQA